MTTRTPPAGTTSTPGQRAAAWAVHAYTSLGVVLGFLTVLEAIEGDLRAALLWNVASTFVDATDGALARRVDVKRHVPEFDGALLDNVIDYLTYVFAPVLLLHQGGFLPDGTAGVVVAALPLLASCVQFCRTDAKTEDHLFWGFPSYWNVVATYAVVLGTSVAVTTTMLVVCAVLVFVPIGYLYPSRATAFRRSGLALGGLWAAVMLVLVLQLPDPSRPLALASLGYIAFYLVVSVLLTLRRRRGPVPA